jgi:hypothetical protein
MNRLSNCQSSIRANIFSALRHAAYLLEAIAARQDKCVEIFAAAARGSLHVRPRSSS